MPKQTIMGGMNWPDIKSAEVAKGIGVATKAGVVAIVMPSEDSSFALVHGFASEALINDFIKALQLARDYVYPKEMDA